MNHLISGNNYFHLFTFFFKKNIKLLFLIQLFLIQLFLILIF